jgi:hypothetical protein
MRTIRILATVAVALFAACSSDAAPLTREAPSGAASALLVSASPDLFRRAAALTASRPGYRYTLDFSVRGIPDVPGGTLALRGGGSVDQRTNRSSMSFDVRNLRDSLVASGQATAAELDALFGNGNVDILQDGQTMFMRLPNLAREGITTPWISVALPRGGAADLSGVSGIGPLAGLGGLGSPGTPADYLDHLKAIDGTITTVGVEQVRGTATTHYRGALNMVRLLESTATTPEERAQLDASRPFLAALSLPYDVWLDGDGLPRRMSLTLDFGTFAFGGAGTPSAPPAPAMVVSYDLFDFGNPEVLDLPPASQVTAVDAATFARLGF